MAGTRPTNSALAAAGAVTRQMVLMLAPDCVFFCRTEHPFLFYCEDHVKTKVGDRFTMAEDQRSSVRCLAMSKKFSGPKRDWWQDHEKYYKTLYVCAQGYCVLHL
jgi:hypothetical protein